MDQETKIHHMWCNKGFGEITEGVCMQCERLYRQNSPLDTWTTPKRYNTIFLMP